MPNPFKKKVKSSDLEKFMVVVNSQARANFAVSFELLRIRRLMAVQINAEFGAKLDMKSQKFVKSMMTDPREYEGPPDYSEAEGGPPK